MASVSYLQIERQKVLCDFYCPAVNEVTGVHLSRPRASWTGWPLTVQRLKGSRSTRRWATGMKCRDVESETIVDRKGGEGEN